MHRNDNNTRATSTKLGILTSGTCKKCLYCAVSKARQKPIRHSTSNNKIVSDDRSLYAPCEKLSIDISNTKMISATNNQFWNLSVNTKTDKLWSHFLKRRKHLKEHIILLIEDEIMEKLGHKVNIIRCDNAGENTKLQKATRKHKIGIKFEFTARSDPEQNAIIEQKFATMWGR